MEDAEDGDEYGDEDDEDDDLDHDELILGNTVDLINALAKAFGDQFAPTFQNVLAKEVSVYATEKHPKNDRNAALGCFAETFAQAPATIPPHFEQFMQLVDNMSNTKDSKTNRNLAYAIGVLAQHAQTLF